MLRSKCFCKKMIASLEDFRPLPLCLLQSHLGVTCGSQVMPACRVLQLVCEL